jgi:membrane dipeptidase
MNADKILKEVPVVEAHSDLLADVLYLRRQGQTRVIETKFLPGFRAGNVKIVVCAIFIETMFVPGQALEMALEQIDGLHQEMIESPGLFCLCTNYADIEAALERGEVAFLLSLEGAEPVGTNLSLLHTFHRLGVRMIGPAWGRRNLACEGSTLVAEPNPSAGGLSNFGRDLVRESERLGLLIDLSHLNDAGVRDVADLTRCVLFASHSNTRALNPMERNVSDDIIRLIASRGGVIGMNAVNTICAEEETEATSEMLVRHMEHVRDVAGVQHIGLGLDFFGGMNLFAPVLPPQKMKRAIRDVIQGHAALPELVTVMQQRGWLPEEIQAVLGNNFLRMYRENLG